MITVKKPEDDQNQSSAPTMGNMSGQLVGQNQGQRSSVSGQGSGFTNMQSYIRANEGQNNPNAQLVTKRTNQAGERQQEAQKGFEQFQNQSVNTLGQTRATQDFTKQALGDATKFVQDQNNVSRFRNLATGQERVVDPNEILNQTNQQVAGLQSQRQQLGNTLNLNVGEGLQDYLRAQRERPEQATAGEGRLDRFLAQSTPSGVSAIEQAQMEANRIKALENPDITNINELSNLINQNRELLSGEGITNELYKIKNPELDFVGGLNRSQLGQYLGVDYGQAKRATEETNRLNQLIAQENQAIANINADRQRLQDEINVNVGVAGAADIATYGLNPWVAMNAAVRTQQIQSQQADMDRMQSEIDARRNQYQSELGGIDQSMVSKYGTIESDAKLNREQVLQKYDANRLARLQALAQLSGQDISSMLQGGIV
jgi:hypothetical protein